MRAIRRVAASVMIASVVAGSLAATTVTTAAPARTMPGAAGAGAGRIKVMSFNFCGQACNHGKKQPAVGQLVNEINDVQPNVMLLQEICSNQLGYLMTYTNEVDNWRLSGRADVNERRGCSGGQKLEDAVLTHGKAVAGSWHTKQLSYTHGHGKNRWHRLVGCLQVVKEMPRRTEVCVTHIGLQREIGTAHQAAQIHEAYAFARHEQGANTPLIFGGDFNAVPTANAFDSIYATGGGGAAGAMVEVDACAGANGRAHQTATCNATTHDATPYVKQRTKNDYIFGSHHSFIDISAKVQPSKHSDHDLLIGRLFMCAAECGTGG